MSEQGDSRGTFACPVCGHDKPHWHDPKEVERIRLEKNVIRPAFERELVRLCTYDPFRASLQFNGWGHPMWWDRWDGGLFAGAYKNDRLEAMWRLWCIAWSESSAGNAGVRAPGEGQS